MTAISARARSGAALCRNVVPTTLAVLLKITIVKAMTSLGAWLAVRPLWEEHEMTQAPVYHGTALPGGR